MQRIRITAAKAGVSMTAKLNDSATAQAIATALPMQGAAQRWGDEVYFEIPVDQPEENPQAKVPSGTIAYWPPGKALCIFFGQTPYSPVNLVGKVDGDEKTFAKVRNGDTVTLEKA